MISEPNWDSSDPVVQDPYALQKPGNQHVFFADSPPWGYWMGFQRWINARDESSPMIQRWV